MEAMMRTLALIVVAALLGGCEQSPPPPAAARSASPAVASSADPVVYKTKSGAKYHRAGCQYLSKSSIETTLKKAKAAGLGACSKCGPPE